MLAFIAFMLAGAFAYVMEFTTVWCFNIKHRVLALILGYVLCIPTYALAYLVVGEVPNYWVIIVGGGTGYFGLLALTLIFQRR